MASIFLFPVCNVCIEAVDDAISSCKHVQPFYSFPRIFSDAAVSDEMGNPARCSNLFFHFGTGMFR